MKPIPPSPALRAVGQRVVWFKPPDEALADPIHFLAHVMTYGTIEDVAAVKAEVPDADWIEALRHAPPGVFDPRSWAYWHLKLGLGRAPPMPVRRFA